MVDCFAGATEPTFGVQVGGAANSRTPPPLSRNKRDHARAGWFSVRGFGRQLTTSETLHVSRGAVWFVGLISTAERDVLAVHPRVDVAGQLFARSSART
jgi:hypothetical protein